MKKIITILVAAALLSACGPSEEEKAKAREAIKAETEMVNTTIAGQWFDYLFLNYLTFDGETMTYNYIVDEDEIDWPTFLSTMPFTKNVCQTYWEGKDVKYLTDHFKTIKGKIVYSYVGNESGKVDTFTIRPY